MLSADVAVVGGGPAGAAAAITLARAGRHVVLVDKARFPRDKACGDGLTTGALRRFEALGLEPGAVGSWLAVQDVSVRSPSGHEVRFPLPRGAGTYAAVARRVDLDAALLQVARAAGVHVHEGHALVAAATKDDRMVLEVAGLGRVEARYAIGADGMWSPLRRLLGVDGAAPAYLGEWHAFRQYFTGVGHAASSQLWVWFDGDLLPGYAWSFPLPGGRANVGFGILRTPDSPTHAMKDLWPAILRRPHIAAVLGATAEPESPHKAWPIPARVASVALTAGGGRALFVGDAARATDPMTGEGIGQALETGMLAAEAIVTAGSDGPALAATTYAGAVGRTLAIDHRLGATLSGALGTDFGARASVRVAGTTAWTRRNFGRWLFEDYPRALLATPSRWRRGIFSGPGAFR